jgi:type I restriction enzyme S subunit
MRFRPSHVLYGSRRTYLRKVAVADFEGICANTTYVVEPAINELLPEFLPLVMTTEAFHAHSIGQSKGSVNPYINFSDLAWYEFMLPPVDEQRRITEILTAVDAQRTALEVAEASTEVARRRTIEDLLGPYAERTVPLGDAAAWASGGTPSRSNATYWGGEIPWLSPKDMKADVVSETEETLTGEGAASTRLVDEGTTLIVVRGMILAHTFPVVRAGRRMAFNQDVKALVAVDEVLPDYLNLWLRQRANRCLALVSETSHGTKRIPTDALQSLRFELPPIERQETIVAMNRHLAALREAITARGEATDVLRRALMNELLTDVAAHDLH